MKSLLIIFSLVILSLGVSAQRKGGFSHVYAPRVVVVPSVSYGIGLGYPYYGYPFFGYPYYGYPFGYSYPYYGGSRNSDLSLKIQSIKVDYRNRIRTTRNDKSISHAERRQAIRNLKAEREQAIINAQRDFHQRRMNYQNPGNNNNNQQPGNNNQNPGTNSPYQNNNTSGSL